MIKLFSQFCCKKKQPPKQIQDHPYVGNILNGRPHGLGKMIYSNGDYYVGDWFQGRREGYGKHYYNNGERYHGQFLNDKREGTGVLYLRNGSTLEGIFSNDKLNGKIKFTDNKHKKQFQQLWDDGVKLNSKLVSIKSQDSNVQEEKLSEDCSLQLISYREKIITKGDSWTISQVCDWLNKIGLAQYSQSFRRHQIKGQFLMKLNDQELVQIGMNSLGHRLNFFKARDCLVTKPKFGNLHLQDNHIINEESDESGEQFQPTKKDQPISQRKGSDLLLRRNSRDVSNIESQQPNLIRAISRRDKDNDQTSSESSQEDQDKRNQIKDMYEFMVRNDISLNFLIPSHQVQYIKELGEGAFGKVHLARWLSNYVAVKCYVKRGRAHSKSLGDFLRQVEMIHNFRHPNIVLYMGVAVEFNKYSMITQYVEQGSLFDHLHKHYTQLDDLQVLQIVEDMALGMNYLHAKNVMHCDLKSSNVLITNDWKVKLCDFGLSQKNKKKYIKSRVGTPQWMAPQILRGQKYDSLSDVYSFGIIIWEILSGLIPYDGLQVPQIIGTVGFDDQHRLPTPTRHHSFLEQLMWDCLKRSPSSRPSFKSILQRISSYRNSPPLKKKKS